MLYGNVAIQRLAAALDAPGRFPFPLDLFEAVGMELPVQYAPIERGPAVVNLALVSTSRFRAGVGAGCPAPHAQRGPGTGGRGWGRAGGP